MNCLRIILFGISFVLFAGCGIDTNAAPVDLDPEELGLNDGLAAALAVPDNIGPETNIGYLYLIDSSEQLQLVSRQFRTPPTPQQILEALVQLPLANEVADLGVLNTALPTSLSPRHINTESETGVITVEVSDEADLRTIARTDTARTQRIFAQIVCSLDWYQISDNVPVAGVLIQDSQGPIIATDTQTVSIIGPATPGDFNNCRSIPEL